MRKGVGCSATRGWQVKLSKRGLLLARFIVAAGVAMPPTLAVAAKHPHVRFAPCPAVVPPEPPPCTYKTGVNVKLITCAAPGGYWFSSATGLGCAGKVSDIKIELARVQLQDGRMRTQYTLTYKLYTGNGFQKDQSGLHIDMMVRDGGILPDVLGNRIEFDLRRCYYGPGQNFRIPRPGDGIIAVTSFDFTEHDIVSSRIRVDSAKGTARHYHC